MCYFVVEFSGNSKGIRAVHQTLISTVLWLKKIERNKNKKKVEKYHIIDTKYKLVVKKPQLRNYGKH